MQASIDCVQTANQMKQNTNQMIAWSKSEPETSKQALVNQKQANQNQNQQRNVQITISNNFEKTQTPKVCD